MSRLTRILLTFVLLSPQLVGASSPAEKKIALTFERLPYMEPLGYWRPRELSNMILKNLEEAQIIAAGFVVEEKIDDKPSTYVVLSDWVTRGHTLGNQTWGDADFNVLTLDQFMEHATSGQKYLKRVSRAHEFNFRYFRFPQLHEGNEKKKKERFRKQLARGDYRIAHVSVKTSDWVFNRPVIENETNQERMLALKRLYLQHIEEMLNYSEKQSEAVFGREITQILQLRCGVATAYFLPDLIGLLRNRGYTFVSLPAALDDSAYQTEEDYVGPLGLTFTDRVAATRGLAFDEDSGVPSEGTLRARIASLDRSSR